MRWGTVAAMLLAGCVDSSSVVCGDRICPENTTCAELVGLTSGEDPHRCVDRDALSACDGVATLEACSYAGVAMGACYATADGGVCLESGCGNGFVDKTEVCDDGNGEIGDGCSQACRSDETCGNGLVDPLKIENNVAVPNERCDDGDAIGHDACNACQLENAGWTSVGQQTPDPRVAANITFDPARGRFVMFGGEYRTGSNNSFLVPVPKNDTWEGDGASWIQMHPPVSPSARYGASIAYFPPTGRTVLFGGNDGTDRDDLWQWDGTHWAFEPPPMSPPGRKYDALVYDGRRKVLVMFGGSLSSGPGGTPLADTWEWNGSTWRQVVTSTTPPAYPRPAMAFDPVRGVVVMAGMDSNGAPGTWEYDGANWSSKATSTTPVITTSMLAYDAVGHRVLAFARADVAATSASTYAWNGTAWTDLGQVHTVDFVEPSLASNPNAGRVISIGGIQNTGCPGASCSFDSADDTWAWNGAGWIHQQLLAPEPRFDAAAILDTRRDEVLLIGGTNGSTDFRDTWELDGMSWHQYANVPFPQGRHASALAYDSDRDEVVAFGGDRGTGSFADTWVRASSNWQLRTTTTAPSPRGHAAMAYDVARHRVILFGGVAEGPNVPDAETWSWDGSAWLKLSPAHSPPARQSATLQWDPIRRELVLFGGYGQTYFGDTWTWDGADWTNRTTTFGPSARKGAGLAWDATRETMVLVGGSNLTPALDDSWEWNGSEWAPLVASNPAPARHQAALVSAPEGAGIIEIGGEDQFASPLGDQWRLRWDGDQTYEQCQSTADIDGDGAKGCDDPDCWPACTPLCPPGATCDPNAPHCGDHSCDSALENCHTCPGDCTCTAVCGDTFCDAGETQATCPGDCTP